MIYGSSSISTNLATQTALSIARVPKVTLTVGDGSRALVREDRAVRVRVAAEDPLAIRFYADQACFHD